MFALTNGLALPDYRGMLPLLASHWGQLINGSCRDFIIIAAACLPSMFYGDRADRDNINEYE
ncbi:MAG: hypothetical protein M3Q16_04845 [Pseudomonadota bacterium]|nr:hypothetical protein [Pseudomonadota bacterium]